MALVGKRYVCATCDAELLCAKPGDRMPSCCGAEMGLKEAKPLPSSD